MGIGKFHLSDFDHFEIANLNRQFGAILPTLGRSKIEVMGEMLRAINPEIEIRYFPKGIQTDTVNDFLDGADIVLDGIDFFAYDSRRLLFNESRRHGLYVLPSGPMGFGATLQIFSPTGMRFDDWFGITAQTPEVEKFIAFVVGITPVLLHRPYLDAGKIDLLKGRGPVVAAACVMASGLIATETVKILLGRGPIDVIPKYFQFDAYRHIYKKGYLPGGAKNPIQIFKRWLVRRIVKRISPSAS
jgi:molybdopterin/thiamine biosynthesis adenylyltransferase